MNRKILNVFQAINHRTIQARKYETTKEIYRNMNFAALQTLYALNIIDYSQYNDLYHKVYLLETITIKDVDNLI